MPTSPPASPTAPSRPVVTIGPSTPLTVASGRMTDHGIGALVVVEDGVVLGVLTERDVLVPREARQRWTPPTSGRG